MDSDIINAYEQKWMDEKNQKQQAINDENILNHNEIEKINLFMSGINEDLINIFFSECALPDVYDYLDNIYTELIGVIEILRKYFRVDDAKNKIQTIEEVINKRIQDWYLPNSQLIENIHSKIEEIKARLN